MLSAYCVSEGLKKVMHVLGKQQEKGRDALRAGRSTVLCAAVCCVLCCGRNTAQHRKEEICVAVQFLITL